MEGTTSAAAGVCGGAGTLRMVPFWEGHLAESSDHPKSQNPPEKSSNPHVLSR